MAWLPRKRGDGGSIDVEEIRARARAFQKADKPTEAFPLWAQLADAGDAEAAYMVGLHLEAGLGVLQSFGEAVDWFHRAAERGWTKSYAKLGDVYFRGRLTQKEADKAEETGPTGSGALALLTARMSGVRQDYEAAALWNGKAAELGDPSAQVRLGFQYAAGLGLPQSYKEAAALFYAAAVQKDPSGQLCVGMILAGGHGRPRDVKTAAQWFERSAAQDNPSAKLFLAVLLEEENELPKDPARVAKLLSEAAEAKIPEAMYRLGQSYRFGRGVPEDVSIAETWLRRAAIQSHLPATFALGVLLRDRHPPDFISAANCFTAAAEADYGPAQFALAELYERGVGVPKDAELAAFWFAKAADRGVGPAYQRLGAMFASGDGIEQDLEAAADWFRRAESVGGPGDAAYELGVLHQYGLGVERDEAKALDYYQTGSKEGDARASLKLGILYATGEIVAQDWDAAAKYYGLAAGQGDVHAEMNLAFLLIRGLTEGGPDLGVQILEESGSFGNPKAYLALHGLFADGVYIKADPDRANAYLDKAIKAGFAPAVIVAARKLRDGQTPPGDPAAILKSLREIAEAGDAAAQSTLGLLTYEGAHLPADFAAAVAWFTKAATQGDTFAQAWLGDVMASGSGVAKDIPGSLQWYRLAAQGGHSGALLAITAAAPPPGVDREEDAFLVQSWLKLAEAGDALAQRMIGDFLVHGTRCKASVPEGTVWLRRSARQGNVAAKLLLASLIASGLAAPENPAEVLRLLGEAAEQGSPEAATNLGLLHQHGVAGVPKDERAALAFYRRAASQNHAPAQVALADLLLTSRPTDAASASEARRWLETAAAIGSPEATERLRRLAPAT